MEKCYRLSTVLDYDGQVVARMTSLANRTGCNMTGLNWSGGRLESKSRLEVELLGEQQPVLEFQDGLAAMANGAEVEMLDPSDNPLDWELALVRVRTGEETREEMFQMASLFGASLLTDDGTRLVFQACGPSGRLAAFTKAMARFGRLEVGRSGRVKLAPCRSGRETGDPAKVSDFVMEEAFHWAEA